MPMHRHTPTPIEASFGTRSGVTFLRFRGPTVDRTSRPVISLHGFAGTDGAEAVLRGFLDWRRSGAYPYDALTATGRTIYIPFTGSSFGAGAGSWGPGTTVIPAMAAQAAADGLSFDAVDLIGGSMGATNSLAWMHTNPTGWHRAVMYVPGLDIGHLWDLGAGIRTAIETAYGTTGRTNVLAASAATDAIRLDWDGFDLGERLTLIGSPVDPLIEWATVQAFAATTGAALIESSGGHFTLDVPEIDEYELLAALT